MSGDVNFHISGSVADAKERALQAQERNLRSMVLQGGDGWELTDDYSNSEVVDR